MVKKPPQLFCGNDTCTHTHTEPGECVRANLCIVTQIERADWPQETLYQASASQCSQTTWRIRHVAAKGAAAAAAGSSRQQKVAGRPSDSLYSFMAHEYLTTTQPNIPPSRPTMALYPRLSNAHTQNKAQNMLRAVPRNSWKILCVSLRKLCKY